MELLVEVLVHRRCGAVLRVRCRPRHARGRAPGANMGGAKLAFHSYRDCQAQAEEERLADDSSEDQHFFLSSAQVWCTMPGRWAAAIAESAVRPVVPGKSATEVFGEGAGQTIG